MTAGHVEYLDILPDNDRVREFAVTGCSDEVAQIKRAFRNPNSPDFRSAAEGLRGWLGYFSVVRATHPATEDLDKLIDEAIAAFDAGVMALDEAT